MKYLIVLLITLSGCATQGPQYQPDPDEITAIVAGVMAFYDSKQTDKPDTPDRPRTCTDCKGDGLMPSGDELEQVTCWCGSECQCEPPGAAGDTSKKNATIHASDRMLLFTADWCGPCVRWKNNVAPLMKQSNWLIGESAASHIQTINGDDFPQLVARYSVRGYPTFIVIDGYGRELRRRSGPLTSKQVVDLYHGRTAEAAQTVGEPAAPPASQSVQYYYQTDRRGRRSRRLFRGCFNGSCN